MPIAYASRLCRGHNIDDSTWYIFWCRFVIITEKHLTVFFAVLRNRITVKKISPICWLRQFKNYSMCEAEASLLYQRFWTRNYRKIYNILSNKLGCHCRNQSLITRSSFYRVFYGKIHRSTGGIKFHFL